jgi:hypothetical protein
MITTVETGTYTLVQTTRHTKMLRLDDDTFIWLHTKTAGGILMASAAAHDADFTLSTGHYYLYHTEEEEPHLTDSWHLELEFGENTWQGYLLPTGLPDDKKTRKRILPTNQIITGNPRHQSHFFTRHIFPLASPIPTSNSRQRRISVWARATVLSPPTLGIFNLLKEAS